MRRTTMTWTGWGLILASVLTVLPGCGASEQNTLKIPPLAPVSGVVTMDGQPLVGAVVVFEPGGISMDKRESSGITGSDGKYELSYIENVPGAVMEPMTVRISKLVDEQQQIPAKYNSSTTLNAEVKAGSNTFDFSLTSK